MMLDTENAICLNVENKASKEKSIALRLGGEHLQHEEPAFISHTVEDSQDEDSLLLCVPLSPVQNFAVRCLE